MCRYNIVYMHCIIIKKWKTTNHVHYCIGLILKPYNYIYIIIYLLITTKNCKALQNCCVPNAISSKIWSESACFPVSKKKNIAGKCLFTPPKHSCVFVVFPEKTWWNDGKWPPNYPNYPCFHGFYGHFTLRRPPNCDRVDRAPALRFSGDLTCR